MCVCVCVCVLTAGNLMPYETSSSKTVSDTVSNDVQ